MHNKENKKVCLSSLSSVLAHIRCRRLETNDLAQRSTMTMANGMSLV